MFSFYFFLALLISTFSAHESFAAPHGETNVFLPIVTDISIKQKGSISGEFPKYYRTPQDAIEAQNSNQLLVLEGLQELAIAGTAQFTRSQLKAITEDLNTPVLVIDLRQETHFIMEDSQGKEFSISPFFSQNLSNIDKTIEEIAWDHLIYKDYLLNEGLVTLHYTKNGEVQYDVDDPTYEIAYIHTEKEIVELLNEISPAEVSYLHMPFTDHKIPPVDVIDTFIELFRTFEDEHAWTMLFHCRAGRGRTGQLMVMSDMLANARKHQLTCDQIIKRQALLGSPDFAAVDPAKVEQSLERHEFLQHFYLFAISDDGYASGASYSSWLQVINVL